MHHEGWVLYVWTNPDRNKEEIKASFIKGAELDQFNYLPAKAGRLFVA
jgi:hypothetical protein